MSDIIVSWNRNALVHNDRIPQEIGEKEWSENHHASGLVLPMTRSNDILPDGHVGRD